MSSRAAVTLPPLYRHRHSTTAPAVKEKGQDYVPVSRQCALLKYAWQFNISSVSVALAASIYQRVYLRLIDAHDTILCSVAPHLGRRLVDYGISPFVTYNRAPYGPKAVFAVPPVDHDSHVAIIVYMVCLHIAVKATFIPRHTPKRLGRHYSFRSLATYAGMHPLPPSDLVAAEVWIMRLLDYNVLPILYFSDDDDALVALRTRHSSRTHLKTRHNGHGACTA